MKNKDIISAAEKYIESAEKDTYAIRKAFIDGARWMNEQEGNNLILGGVRFKFPTDKQIVEFAILFNEGKLEKEKLTDMVAMADCLILRLFENGDVSIPSIKEPN